MSKSPLALWLARGPSAASDGGQLPEADAWFRSHSYPGLRQTRGTDCVGALQGEGRRDEARRVSSRERGHWQQNFICPSQPWAEQHPSLPGRSPSVLWAVSESSSLSSPLSSCCPGSGV